MTEQYNNADVPPPARAPFPGSLTPGWNDPPPVASASAAGRQRLDLRKRVAYPIQSTTGNAHMPVMGGVQPPAYPSPPAYTAPTHQINQLPQTQQQQPPPQQQQYNMAGWQPQ